MKPAPATVSPVAPLPTGPSNTVTCASVCDIAVSWDRYERSLAELVDPAPHGLIACFAGPTQEGVRIIALWDGRDALERFHADRMAPAIAGFVEPVRPVWTMRELDVVHVACGAMPLIHVPITRGNVSC